MPEKEHIVSLLTYVVVLAALMILLALTILAAFIDLDQMAAGPNGNPQHQYWNLSVAIVIAMLKATLIILFFMHLKYSSKLTWAFATAGFVWLGIMLVLSMTDYLSRGHPGPWPKGEPLSPSPNFMRELPDKRSQVPGADSRPIRPVIPRRPKSVDDVSDFA